MADSSVAALVNREAMGKALALARVECRNDQRWLNAVNRAALNLEACPWQFDGEMLVIASATMSRTKYTVTARSCPARLDSLGRHAGIARRADCRSRLLRSLSSLPGCLTSSGMC